MSNNITIYPNLSDLVSVSILPSDVVDVKGFLEQVVEGTFYTDLQREVSSDNSKRKVG